MTLFVCTCACFGTIVEIEEVLQVFLKCAIIRLPDICEAQVAQMKLLRTAVETAWLAALPQAPPIMPHRSWVVWDLPHAVTEAVSALKKFVLEPPCVGQDTSVVEACLYTRDFTWILPNLFSQTCEGYLRQHDQVQFSWPSLAKWDSLIDKTAKLVDASIHHRDMPVPANNF